MKVNCNGKVWREGRGEGKKREGRKKWYNFILIKVY